MTTKTTRDVAPGAARKLKSLLDSLEKKHGAIKMLPGKSALEQAIYLILREGSDQRKALKALKALEDEYVEWNELRVATPKEIVAVLDDIGLQDLDDKISRILALLARLFYDFHKKDLEFVRIFEGPQRQKIMNQLTPLGPHIILVLLQFFDDMAIEPQGLVVTQEHVNQLVKLNLIRKTSSLAVAKKIIEKLVPKDDWYRFHFLLLRDRDAA